MQNGTLINRRLEQFDAKHGAFAFDGRWSYYADGAMREASPYGALVEPPTDARKRQENIVRFHELRLEQAVSKFDKLKTQMLNNRDIDPNDPDEMAPLLRRQRRVRYAQRRYEEAKKELRRLTPKHVAFALEDNEDERQAAINSINI